MSNTEEKTTVMINSQFGIYIPQMFAKSYLEDQRWIEADPDEIEILGDGPDHPQYWEAWEHVLDQAKYMDKDGVEWKLWLEGDLFCYTGDGSQWV